VNSQPDDSQTPNDISVSWLFRSLVRGIVDGLRRNKLAAALAALTAVTLIGLSVNYRLDGLRDYQESILPRLLRLEYGFNRSLQIAESTTGDWRAYYFENTHRQLRDILRAARLARPTGVVARAKHRKFIQYYERLDLEFTSVGAEARINPEMDYVRELKLRMDALKPIRDTWAQWAELKTNGS